VNPHLAWYVARAAGIVAWALLSAAVIWGLLLSTRLLRGRPTPRWLLDLHRFLGGLAVTFTAVHIGGVVGDSYLHFGAADLLVPFASSWRPGAVALGVVGLWLLLAVELTSLLMRRLPRRLWHSIHMSSYLLFWTATLHGLLAGTDSRHVLYVLATNSVVALVLFLTLVRSLASPRRARSARARAHTPAPAPGSPTHLDTGNTIGAFGPTGAPEARATFG
jgi:predicted ferric reductase